MDQLEQKHPKHPKTPHKYTKNSIYHYYYGQLFILEPSVIASAKGFET
jgi:hypothetical protein